MERKSFFRIVNGWEDLTTQKMQTYLKQENISIISVYRNKLLVKECDAEQTIFRLFDMQDFCLIKEWHTKMNGIGDVKKKGWCRRIFVCH